MKCKTASSQRGAFTLIELLVVIGIITILAGLLIQTAGYVQDKAAQERTKGEIAALVSAIETYKLEYGAYPLSDGGTEVKAKPESDTDTSTKILIQRLYLDAVTEDKRPYAFDKRMLSSYKPNSTIPYEQVIKDSQYLQDAYGNSYHYQYPGDPDRSGTNYFDLWSQGKRGSGDSSNTNKWLKNW